MTQLTDTVLASQDDTELEVAVAYDAAPVIATLPNGIDKRQVFNAFNVAESLNDYKGKTIRIIGAIQTRGMRNDPTGKNPPAPCINTTLLCEDGTALFTQSSGIARSIQSLINVFGPCDKWDGNVVEMAVRESKLPNGTSLKTLYFPK